MRQLQGIHHVTAVTSSAEDIYAFFTNILGLRLVKKTVNQDDIRTYHLFFADDQGSPGTDMTFFDFRGSVKVKRGTNEIYKTGFRVTNHASLAYWQKRLQHYRIKHDGIKTLLGRSYLNFFDFDDQEYALFSDEGVPGIIAGEPWKKGPVPDEFAIVGLGPIFIRVNDLPLMTDTLVHHLGMRLVGKEHQYSIFEMGQGGNGGTVVIDNQPLMAPVIQGFGTVHHVAFRVTNRDDLEEWRIYYNEKGISNSGYVNRFYFESLYARVYPRVLFEIATDGPGFIDDEEPYETLGETLALPPQFRNRRELIQRMVRPIDTVRSKRVFKKEYFESKT